MGVTLLDIQTFIKREAESYCISEDELFSLMYNNFLITPDSKLLELGKRLGIELRGLKNRKQRTFSLSYINESRKLGGFLKEESEVVVDEEIDEQSNG